MGGGVGYNWEVLAPVFMLTERDQRILRFAYIAEFFLAAIAAQILWTEIGGAGHMDLVPWYWKLAFLPGFSFAVVRATAAAVENDLPWNSRALLWFGVAVLIAGGMAAATYYAHVHEQDDSGTDQDPTPVAIRRAPAARRNARAVVWRGEGSVR